MSNKMGDLSPTSTVPPYEANPSQYPQQHSTPPVGQTTAVYGAPTGQQQSGMIHQNYPQSPPIISENKYSYGPETPLTSPPIQPQSTMAPVKQEYYAPEQQQQQPQMQQQMYPQQQQQTYQTAVNLANLSEAPAPVDCPVCRHRALTVVEKHSGNTVHLWAALACVCFCLGCIPYLIPGLKDVQHKCGNCGVMLAEWHKSGRTVVLQHA